MKRADRPWQLIKRQQWALRWLQSGVMTPLAGHLFATLLVYGNEHLDHVYVSRLELGNVMGRSLRTVTYAISELTDAGAVTVVPGTGRAVSRFIWNVGLEPAGLQPVATLGGSGLLPRVEANDVEGGSGLLPKQIPLGSDEHVARAHEHTCECGLIFIAEDGVCPRCIARQAFKQLRGA